MCVHCIGIYRFVFVASLNMEKCLYFLHMLGDNYAFIVWIWVCFVASLNMESSLIGYNNTILFVNEYKLVGYRSV